MTDIMNELYSTVTQRKQDNEEGSYTSYLFKKGLDKILKKCGEECAEVICAAKNNDKTELVCEISDLLYHLTVLMAQRGVSVDDVAAELSRREQKTGNLKVMRQTDLNT